MINLTLISFICSFLWTSSLVLLYLDDFKFSSNKFIKYIQTSSLILIPIYIIYKYIDTIHILNYVNDKNFEAKTSIEIGKEAAIEISKGISNLGNNIGLGATVAGVCTAVTKGITKSSLPPVQKAGIITAGGVIGGVIHVGASAINHNNNNNISISSQTLNKSINNDNVNNFLDLSNNSPLEILLQCINILSDINIFLMFILALQLFYKFYITDKPQLNWVEYIFSSTYSDKFKSLIYKIIKLNKNMSMIYIVIVIILLIVSMCSLSYISLELYNNLDNYINVHNSYSKK
jgi:hypothetical protein